MSDEQHDPTRGRCLVGAVQCRGDRALFIRVAPGGPQRAAVSLFVSLPERPEDDLPPIVRFVAAIRPAEVRTLIATLEEALVALRRTPRRPGQWDRQGGPGTGRDAPGGEGGNR